jgi:serine/threonine-protein kinase
VALKTIHSTALEGAQAEEYRARFYREARASGVLAHPGIVPVFDVGEHEGAPFLVMEFVDGRTLADVIKKGERYTLDRVSEIGQQIAEALGYAHRQGVIHRDIKPANILMTSREVYGAERPRITDFGIAKLAASEITTTGQLLGTPSFMPPEQFTGAPIDGRADLFSLGVILYSLATGEQPFPGETMTAVSYKVVYTEPIPPAKLNPAIPARLEAVILKCLAKSPAERYQTGDELAQDLAAMRANAGASAMHAEATAAAVGGSDVTLGPAASASNVQRAPQAGQAATKSTSQPPPKPAAKKQGKAVRFETAFAVVLLSVAAIGVAAAGGWFWLQHRKQAAPQQQAAAVPAAQPAAPQAPQPQQGSPAVAPEPAGQTPTLSTAANPSNSQATAPAPHAAKPSAAKSSAAKTTPSLPPPVAAAAPSPAANPAPAPPATAKSQPPAPASTAAFDPRKADPNTNAKLKIELAKFPSGLPFTVEMDRQPYLHFITGDKTDLNNLYVPPGVQQFRVTFKSGGQEWDSNIASEDFKAKKRKTLKIQLTEKGNPLSKITLPISRDAQMFLSFSTPLF